jgi:predicted PurR-regulated permease PerM
MRMSTAEFCGRAAIVVGVALVPVLIYFLFDVVLMSIGAVLVAVLLRLVAKPFSTWMNWPESIALFASGLIIVVLVAGAIYLFGLKISTELQDVLQRANTAQTTIVNSLQNSDAGKLILSHIQAGNLSVADVLARVFTVSSNFIEGVVVTVITGVYLAAQPAVYREGFIQLFPQKWHPNASETLDDLAAALQLWLLGQLIQMLIIGLLSTLAVWLIGLPSPLALGIIAGVAEFVPYLGPIAAAFPALLVATTDSTHAMFWTLAAYVLIHQVEGNVVLPLVQRHMIFIPPAVLLLGIVAISSLFGVIAILFAAPIAVVLFVLVKKLYVRDSLGEETPIPGESSP